MDIGIFFNWPNLFIVGLWVLVGFFLGWHRGLGLAVLVPAIAAGIPTVLSVHMNGTVELWAGLGTLALVQGIALPIAASAVGGHIATAINPVRRSKEMAVRAYHEAKAQADELSKRLYSTAVSSDELEIGSPVTEAELHLARARLAAEEDELRVLRRRLN
jgi:hypothetical protein